MPSLWKSWIARAARRIGLDIKRWYPLTRDQIERDDPVLSLKSLFQRNSVTPRVILDVGANRGDYTSRFCTLFPEASVYCFEPTPDVYKALRERFADDGRVQVFELAVSDVDESVFFNIGSDPAWNSLLDTGASGMAPHPKRSIEVRATRLDTFARNQDLESIDLLKLDIQGAELRALRGALGLLAAGRISTVLLEVNFAELYAKQADFQSLSRLMFDNNYWMQGIYQAAMSSGVLRSADVVFAHSRLDKQHVENLLRESSN